MMQPLINLIENVVTSWQVIAITIAFFIYWSIVSSAVNPGKSKAKDRRNVKAKRPKVHAPVISKDTDTSGLGLEE